MFLGVVEFPGPPGPSHDVEVVQLIAMDRRAGVIAPGHQGHIAIFHRHGFIELAVIGVNPLEGKALGWVDPVIIGLFQSRLVGQFVFVMLVGRIGRGIARGVNSTTRRFPPFPIRQDVGDMAHVGALARVPAQDSGG